MTELIAGYGRAVQQLRSVGRGRYPGPAVTETVLDRAFTSIAGLDTGALRGSAQLAAGNADTAGVQGFLGPLMKFFGSVGAGLVVSELIEKVEDWVTNRGEATEVADAADRAADAIDTTVLESDGGIEAILLQLAEIIGQISSHLATIDPEKHPELFMTTLQAGADIIDDAAAMVLGLCADRDRAIEDCYCALIDHGNRVCGQPDPALAPAVTAPQATGTPGSGVDGGTGGTGGSGGSGGSNGSDAGLETSRATSPVTSPVTSPASAPPMEGDAGDELNAVTKESGEDLRNCSEDTEKEQSDCPPDPPHTEKPSGVETPDTEIPDTETPDTETPEEDLTGDGVMDTADSEGMLLGVLGAGLLVAGVGLIVDFLEDAVQDLVAGVGQEMPVDMATDMTPQTPTEATGQLPADAISPDHSPAPAESQDNETEATSVATPEEQLHLVPEPAPKPSPNVVSAAAVDDPTPVMPSSESTPVAHQAPVTPVAPVAVAQQTSAQPAQPMQPMQPPLPDPAGPPGSPDTQPRIHKAGGW